MTYWCFAVAAPGLEGLVAQELESLGIRPVESGAGGVAFQADARALYSANLQLRVASRVVIRLARFHAEAFHDLERHAKRVPFERFLARGAQVHVTATCRKSRLYHSDAVAERVARAIERYTGTPDAGTSNESAVLVLARIFRDECTISLDTSGALLHRRGYRLATAKAPMRETLAAGILAVSGWDERSALVDPFCGSGTIPIEAALRARHRAPGVSRSFGFMQWPEFEARTWDEVLAAARAAEGPAQGLIIAADRDAGAAAATLANAERAGVAADIEIRTQPLSALARPAPAGWVVTNPPYGVRVGDRTQLRDLYARLGDVARTVLPGWSVALLGDRALMRETRLPLSPEIQTSNGGIPVAMFTGCVPD